MKLTGENLKLLENCLQSPICAETASEIALMEAILLYHASETKERDEIWASFEKLAKKKSEYGTRFRKSIYQANLDKK